MGGRKIAVALDFSSISKYALTWALENIVKQGDSILLIVVPKMENEDGVPNVWEASESPLMTLEAMNDPSVAKQNHITYDYAVVGVLEAAARAKGITVNVKVYFGDAKVKIANAVVEQKIDTLVMGNRGYSGIKRAFLGSVSSYVVSNVTCPVTIVKLPVQMRSTKKD